MEEVDEFVYLGAKVSKDGSGTENIKNRLRKVRGSFPAEPSKGLENEKYRKEI